MQKHEDGVDHEPQQDKQGWPTPEVQALRLAAFCIVAQFNLLNKSPDELVSCFTHISRCDTAEQLMSRMSEDNCKLFARWVDRWAKKGG